MQCHPHRFQLCRGPSPLRSTGRHLRKPTHGGGTILNKYRRDLLNTSAATTFPKSRPCIRTNRDTPLAPRFRDRGGRSRSTDTPPTSPESPPLAPSARRLRTGRPFNSSPLKPPHLHFCRPWTLFRSSRRRPRGLGTHSRALAQAAWSCPPRPGQLPVGATSAISATPFKGSQAPLLLNSIPIIQRIPCRFLGESTGSW